MDGTDPGCSSSITVTPTSIAVTDLITEFTLTGLPDTTVLGFTGTMASLDSYRDWLASGIESVVGYGHLQRLVVSFVEETSSWERGQSQFLGLLGAIGNKR